MSINDFKSELRGGVATPNRFQILVDFPGFTGAGAAIRQTQFLAQSTSLPSFQLGVTEVPFRGRMLKIAGDRTFDEWTVTFLNDNSFGIRDAFEMWSDGINNVNANLGMDLPDDYFSTVSAFQLNRQDQAIKDYTLFLAWPTTVGEIEVAQDSNDTFETFDVTFAFSDLVTNTTT